MDAQSDLGLLCPYMPEDMFSHGIAYLMWVLIKVLCGYTFVEYLQCIFSLRNTQSRVRFRGGWGMGWRGLNPLLTENFIFHWIYFFLKIDKFGIPYLP